MGDAPAPPQNTPSPKDIPLWLKVVSALVVIVGGILAAVATFRGLVEEPGIDAQATQSALATRSAQQTADARLALSQTQTAAVESPVVVVTWLQGDSPSFDSQADLDWLDRQGYIADRIQTAYRNAAIRDAPQRAGYRYLFMMFTSLKPGQVIPLRFEDIYWEPRQPGAQGPDVDDLIDRRLDYRIRVNGGKEVVLLLLVDASPRSDSGSNDPLLSSPAQAICVKFHYSDLAGREFKPLWYCINEPARLAFPYIHNTIGPNPLLVPEWWNGPDPSTYGPGIADPDFGPVQP